MDETLDKMLTGRRDGDIVDVPNNPFNITTVEAEHDRAMVYKPKCFGEKEKVDGMWTTCKMCNWNKECIEATENGMTAEDWDKKVKEDFRKKYEEEELMSKPIIHYVKNSNDGKTMCGKITTLGIDKGDGYAASWTTQKELVTCPDCIKPIHRVIEKDNEYLITCSNGEEYIVRGDEDFCGCCGSKLDWSNME